MRIIITDMVLLHRMNDKLYYHFHTEQGQTLCRRTGKFESWAHIVPRVSYFMEIHTVRKQIISWVSNVRILLLYKHIWPFRFSRLLNGFMRFFFRKEKTIRLYNLTTHCLESTYYS